MRKPGNCPFQESVTLMENDLHQNNIISCIFRKSDFGPKCILMQIMQI